jgi:hypothetical protein
VIGLIESDEVVILDHDRLHTIGKVSPFGAVPAMTI